MGRDSKTAAVLVVEALVLLAVVPLEPLDVLLLLLAEVAAAFLLKSIERAPFKDSSPTGNSRTTVAFW
ncbi:hypothetical protein D3C81_2271160 [compost metagenome]